MTQNPNRRRRLTADELIAMLVALAGIGTILWWSLARRPNTMVNIESGSVPNEAVGNANVIQTFPLTDSPTAVLNSVPSKIATVQSPYSTTDNVASLPVVAGTAVAVVPPVVDKSIAPEPLVSPSPVSSIPVFTDVPDKYWGKDYITILQERGVLDDFGSGKFDPNAPITRGEYAKMLDRAFDRPVSAQVLDFTDIPTDYPRRVALDKAVKMGFMTGYPKAKFAPEEKIPRYQMQISLAKGMKLVAPDNVDAILAKYPDAVELPTYARPKMGAAISSGLVVKDGQDTQLQPVKSATRGEAAALIYQALVKDGQIPAGK